VTPLTPSRPTHAFPERPESPASPPPRIDTSQPAEDPELGLMTLHS